jgi:hypothetical protein
VDAVLDGRSRHRLRRAGGRQDRLDLLDAVRLVVGPARVARGGRQRVQQRAGRHAVGEVGALGRGDDLVHAVSGLAELRHLVPEEIRHVECVVQRSLLPSTAGPT